MRVLDLFSGIGGFALGLESTGRFSTVGFVERDEYCRAVIRKHWPDVPQHDDIHTYQAGQFGKVDVVTGGFPCQPFSHAGKQRGKEDDRYLWPEMLRVIAQERPTWVIGENVAGIISMELDTVLFDLESIGYATRTFVIPACAVDAPHRRSRVWIVAHADSRGCSPKQHAGGCGKADCGREDDVEPSGAVVAHSENLHGNGRNNHGGIGMEGRTIPEPRDSGWTNDVANSICERQQGSRQLGDACHSATSAAREAANAQYGCVRSEWPAEPDVGRVANGVPSRVDRLRSLGNAVVPQVVAQIGWAISEVA